MSALKFGNPIQILIQMKVNDFSHRPWCFRLRGFHDASFLVESMGAIAWQEYRVFTGVNLTRKMTTRVGRFLEFPTSLPAGTTADAPFDFLRE
jgi:hypothetical protein